MTGISPPAVLDGLLPGSASCSAPVPGVQSVLLQVLSAQQGKVENELLRPGGPDPIELQQLQTSFGRTYDMLNKIMRSEHDTVMSIIRNQK